MYSAINLAIIEIWLFLGILSSYYLTKYNNFEKKVDALLQDKSLPHSVLYIVFYISLSTVFWPITIILILKRRIK